VRGVRQPTACYRCSRNVAGKAIEALRDHLAGPYGKREDAVGEFARAYLKYLETPLAAAKILERRSRYGICHLLLN
jgi:hypothetical protein